MLFLVSLYIYSYVLLYMPLFRIIWLREGFLQWKQHIDLAMFPWNFPPELAQVELILVAGRNKAITTHEPTLDVHRD